MTKDQQSSDGRLSGPLGDLKVLDLTHALAGPYGTMLLADLGADVVKIEPPSGDIARSNPPHIEDDEAYGGYFNSVNRNKRSVVLNLKDDDGKTDFLSLAEKADVVVENFTTETMDRLDLSYERLSEINPQLVYASIRGFGDSRIAESPYSSRPAFDMLAQAMGGVMSVTGTEESGPVKVGPGIGDIFPGTLSVIGILSAVQHRERTGEGQYVDVSMVDSILSLTERIVHQYSITGEAPGPQGNTHPLFFPFDRFDASDGYVVIAAPSPTQWSALCDHMDRPDLADIAGGEGMYNELNERADDLRPIINDWTSQHTKEELFDLLEDDVPCGPVFTAGDIFEDDHFESREMLPNVEHADTNETIQLAGTPIKFSETDSGVRHRAPLLGEHTQTVLEDW